MQAQEATDRRRADVLAEKAARSVRVQLRRGATRSARDLYYEAHSLLRALRQHLGPLTRAA